MKRSSATPRASSVALTGALQRLLAEVQDGLRHGFFDFTLTCEVTGQERRRLILKAGKTYQFVIPKEDCQRSFHHPTSVKGATAMTDTTRRIADVASARRARSGGGAGSESPVADGPHA